LKMDPNNWFSNSNVLNLNELENGLDFV